jgi:hypothetical protein
MSFSREEIREVLRSIGFDGGVESTAEPVREIVRDLQDSKGQNRWRFCYKAPEFFWDFSEYQKSDLSNGEVDGGGSRGGVIGMCDEPLLEVLSRIKFRDLEPPADKPAWNSSVRVEKPAHLPSVHEDYEEISLNRLLRRSSTRGDEEPWRAGRAERSSIAVDVSPSPLHPSAFESMLRRSDEPEVRTPSRRRSTSSTSGSPAASAGKPRRDWRSRNPLQPCVEEAQDVRMPLTAPSSPARPSTSAEDTGTVSNPSKAGQGALELEHDSDDAKQPSGPLLRASRPGLMPDDPDFSERSLDRLSRLRNIMKQQRF